ncbi:sialidase family protein [Lentzea flava]|uniref:BNR repeat-like domain-containing protein n=1 Tax=Lentzea flava TaxID=103732 RepID=A0ABQ2UIA7_9PSEU|nr:sialidase family protein [Lentzea flava]MCP2199810.1 hypothetical protein [Lentzea flava]GGU38167.1 hypothetical protein GCM10010178_32990 [Lentzea flava]
MQATRRPTAVAAAVLLMLFAAAPAASAAPFSAGTDIVVSGPSALTSCPYGASADFAAAYDDTEVEPQVAVNPANPDEMIGATQQDRWPDGGARGLSSWITHDGGASWGKLPDVPWSACQGGPARFGRVTDPWVSYDKAGNAYFIGQPIDSGALGLSAISVTSLDRSTWSWRPPQIIQEDTGDRGVFNDKVSITGDPTRAGYAYATWIRGSYPNDGKQHPIADLHSFAYRGKPMFSRTTDGGLTWSTPVPMRDSNSYFQGNQIAVGPDGTLYNVAANLFTGAGLNDKGVYMGVMTSRDAGLHWSAPAQIAPIRFAQLFVPDNNFPIRAEDYLPDIAVDMTSGAVYVVWADGLGTALNKVVLAKSTDGGRHWSGPTVVATGGPGVQSYNHAIDVSDTGMVTLTYWDDRNNVLGDGVATTDVWVRHSHDGTATWEPEQHLHGPFDHYAAPISYFAPDDPRGLFLGDYMGLETISGNDTIAFFTSTIADGADVHAIRLNHN